MGLFEQKREELVAKAAALQPIADRYAADGNEADLSLLLSHRDEMKSLSEQVANLAQGDAAKADAGRILSMFSNPVGEHQHPNEQSPEASRKAQRSILSPGAQIVTDPEWERWVKSVARDGHVPEGVGVKSPAFPVRSIKSLITGASDTSAGAGVFNDVQAFPWVDLAPRRKLVLRDIVNVATTNSDTVEYVAITAQTNSAAVTAEGTTQSSDAKPEGTRAFAKVTAPVRTIAEWMAITRRALADNGQMRGYIDGTLMEDLELALETEMVTGDGTGEHLTGLEHTANTQSQAFSSDILTTARKAKTLIETVGFDTPNAYLMNPTDWETFDLLQNANLDFYFGGPRQLQNPTLWGLPVITSSAVTAGTPWVGNFKVAYLWDREQAQVLVSDSHSDFFIRNILVLLAEMRATFGVLKPKSLCSFALA